MIPPDFIQTLLGRVDIVDVIDKHVKLKKAGANLVACCPFHTEKSPSFSVSPTKQFYHCFGCGAHGSAIGFLMEYSGASFVEAIKELADGVGMQVPQMHRPLDVNGQPVPQPGVRANPTLAARMRAAFDFYRDQLKRNPRAIDYFKGRGVSGDIAARFGLGYAPDGWQNLESVFEDYREESLADTGLVIDSEAENGKPARRYDRFRDRVMFPIFDSRGSVIGFGGRVLGAGEPKYLNSPETPIFEKGRELYGLWQAKRAIRAANQVVVVEGYMDVVALAQSGIENAVATLGTATTPHHVQKLLKLADNVVFSFDGDAPGQKAAWRALETSLPFVADGKSVNFLFLPEEDDPDTYVRRLGKSAFVGALQAAQPLSELLLERLVRDNPPTGPEQKARLIEAAKPLIGQITAPVLLHFLQSRLAELMGMERSELLSLMPQTNEIKRSPSRSDAPASRVPRRTHPLAAQILARLINFPMLTSRVSSAISNVPELSSVVEISKYLEEADGPINAGALFEWFNDSEHQRVIDDTLKEPVLNDPLHTADDAAAALDDFVERVRRDSRRAELVARQLSGLTAEERAELDAISSASPADGRR